MSKVTTVEVDAVSTAMSSPKPCPMLRGRRSDRTADRLRRNSRDPSFEALSTTMTSMGSAVYRSRAARRTRNCGSEL